jgi:hypothetical protein
MRVRGWRWIGIVAGVIVVAVLAVAGQWQGGLSGAAVLAVGGFVAPEVSKWIKERRSRSARLDEVSTPVLPGGGRQPYGGDAFWLRPEQRVVDFISRPELARLREWCTADGQPGLMLVTGAGGVGKTRLALQLAEELGAAGWLCRQVRRGEEAGVVAAVRGPRRGGVLLIVDYAETRPGVTDLLRGIAGAAGGQLRVLLIARGEGEWWTQLAGAADDRVRALVADAGIVRVGALAAAGLDRGALVRAAVPAFARVVGVGAPEVASVSVPAGGVPVLVLHAAALLIVLDARDQPAAGPARVVADEKVLARLLSREASFWQESAGRAGAGVSAVDPASLRQAVAVACLFTAGDEEDAAALLSRVPGLAGVSAGTVLSVARWLRQLYPVEQLAQPGGSVRWWGALQPDLLSERHVVAELADSSVFARQCLRDLTALQATEALTVLARACAHCQQAPTLITAALRGNLPGLGIPAVEVAVQTPGPVGEIFADVAGDSDVPLETLIQIEEAIPYPTVTLARADHVLARRINDMLPRETARDDIARWRNRLGVLYSQLGRYADTLPPTQEAVTTFRELAAANPDRHRPDLADSLDNLGIRYSELGRPADALPPTQEAVTIRRELAAANPDRHRPDLAVSLENLGVRYSELGRHVDALPPTQEAVTIRRELAAANPDRHRPDLARSLSNLSIWYSELGRPAEAEAARKEALAIRTSSIR